MPEKSLEGEWHLNYLMFIEIEEHDSHLAIADNRFERTVGYLEANVEAIAIKTTDTHIDDLACHWRRILSGIQPPGRSLPCRGRRYFPR